MPPAPLLPCEELSNVLSPVVPAVELPPEVSAPWEDPPEVSAPCEDPPDVLPPAVEPAPSEELPPAASAPC